MNKPMTMTVDLDQWEIIHEPEAAHRCPPLPEGPWPADGMRVKCRECGREWMKRHGTWLPDPGRASS